MHRANCAFGRWAPPLQLFPERVFHFGWGESTTQSQPSFVQTMEPLAAEERAERERQLQEMAAKNKDAPVRDLGIPKDANAAAFQKLKEAGWVSEEKTPLPTADELREAHEKFLKTPIAELYRTADPGEQLLLACKHLRDDHVQTLLKQGAPTTFADKLYGYTPLHIAAINGREVMLAHLLDAGASVVERDIDGRVPLELAQKGMHTVCIKLLEMATARVAAG